MKAYKISLILYAVLNKEMLDYYKGEGEEELKHTVSRLLETEVEIEETKEIPDIDLSNEPK